MAGYLSDVWLFTKQSRPAILNRFIDGVLSADISVGHDDPICVCVDKNNSVWVSTWGFLSKYVNGLKTLDIPVARNAYGMCVGNDNSLYLNQAGSYNIIKVANDSIVPLAMNSTYPAIGGLCIDKDGIVYQPCMYYNGETIYSCISRFNNLGTKLSDICVGLNPITVCVDKDNVLWSLNTSVYPCTLSKIINGSIVSTIPSLSSSNSLCVDKNNAKWVGGSNILYKIVGDSLSKSIVMPSTVRSLCVDKNNSLWAFCDDRKMYKIINDTISFTSPVLGDYSLTYNLSDATGMQSALLFGWGTSPTPPQCYAGGV